MIKRKVPLDVEIWWNLPFFIAVYLINEIINDTVYSKETYYKWKDKAEVEDKPFWHLYTFSCVNFFQIILKSPSFV